MRTSKWGFWPGSEPTTRVPGNSRNPTFAKPSPDQHDAKKFPVAGSAPGAREVGTQGWRGGTECPGYMANEEAELASGLKSLNNTPKFTAH